MHDHVTLIRLLIHHKAGEDAMDTAAQGLFRGTRNSATMAAVAGFYRHTPSNCHFEDEPESMTHASMTAHPSSPHD